VVHSKGHKLAFWVVQNRFGLRNADLRQLAILNSVVQEPYRRFEQIEDNWRQLT
jgi:hypothetical protein